MKRSIIKKIIIGMVIFVLIFGLLTYMEIYSAIKSFETYIIAVNEGRYEDMYKMLSEESKEEYDKERFVEQNKSVYERIEAHNINVRIKDIKRIYIKKSLKGGIQLDYYFDMDMVSGHYLSDFGRVELIQEGFYKWKLNWKSRVIFPDYFDNFEIIVNKTIIGNDGEVYSVLVGPSGGPIESFTELEN